MEFQKIPPVETMEGYFKIALREGSKAAAKIGGKLERNVKIKRAERERLLAVCDSLIKRLHKVVKSFPSVDDLPEFYTKLIDVSLGTGTLKHSLGAFSWAATTISTMKREIRSGYNEDSASAAKAHTKASLGRLKSVVHRIESEAAFLKKARDTLRSFPTLSEDQFTVAISGFPNVGKSTLLRKLTSATPEVQNYAFTTKGLNVGYFVYRHNRIQCIDTPGTLARDRMNVIEKLADATMRYAADVIVYVYDITEPYPLADQERLEQEIRKLGKPVLLYLSKADVLENAAYKECMTDPKEVKESLGSVFEEEFL